MDKISHAAQKLHLTRPDKDGKTDDIREFPSPLSDEQLEVLVEDIKDWQLTHGSLLKLVNTDEDSTVLAQPVGACLFPTLFPRRLFEQALYLQKTYNKLYTRVAEDEEWLFKTLKGLIETDELARPLWEIHQEVKKEGYVQDASLGIFRSDYMLSASVGQEVQLKQVEFNTISCAGGIHSNLISDMHRHLQRTGSYIPSDPTSKTVKITSSLLQPNNTLRTITSGLAAAHKYYGPPKTVGLKETCILMIVQPQNFNIADERPIQTSLWSHAPSVPTFRTIFPTEVLSHTILTPARELLYHPPSRSETFEVSVVYYRAGFEVSEYGFSSGGRKARLQLERSKAIKCPSVLSHLTTFKKVQQALTVPGILRRWLSEEEEKNIEGSFAPMYPMDDSDLRLEARKLAQHLEKSRNYVLKPSLEGGGHNIYGSEIPAFLARTPEKKWSNYILMQKIYSPSINNLLMSAQGLYKGPVISELGVFGVVLWKKNQKGEKGDGNEGKVEIIEDLEPCWSFKTKKREVDEMSVVKGYGCFDSPALVEGEVFEACSRHGN
jgi:glutathione synthase